VILPSGDTLLHFLVESPCEIIESLLKYVQENNLNLRLLPNLKGITPLHICIRDSMSTNSTRLLKLLSTKPLDDHSDFIKDLLPDLLKLCPLALADYLDSRLISVPWTPKFTDGKLNQPSGCEFASVPFNMFPLNHTDMKKALFEDASDYVDVRLPLSLVLADIPDLHKFGNATGKSFLKQLSMVKHSGTLFSKKYIQSLVEVKWPPIRRALMVGVFLPYIVYLMLFNFYALYLVYEREDTFLNLITHVV
jgi:hypothetical protein